MDEQEIDNRYDFNGKIFFVQFCSSIQLEYIILLLIFFVLVKFVDYRCKKKEKLRMFLVKIKVFICYGKRKNFKVKVRSRVVVRSLGKCKNIVYVIKILNIDKINRRKFKKRKQRKKQNDSKREVVKVK